MKTQETVTVIVDAPDPLDIRVQELLKHYRQEGKDAITATGVYIMHDDEERTAVELKIVGNIESVREKIKEEGLTVLEDAITIDKYSSY